MKYKTINFDQLVKLKKKYSSNIKIHVNLIVMKSNEKQVDKFSNYMKSIGRLGGQNKCPQISNDRKIGDYLNIFAL